ncbi:hypothetical protein [Rickettsia endosymbiont of Rhinocyllus conicus]|uniref:hypothetical protein n=1 Tax=Rickettsia endosymbiont of Rhinocyllus conicus TaxID=3066252 RepID=UPI0031331327
MLKKEDFRTLSTSAQAALRKVALRAIDKGEKQSDVRWPNLSRLKIKIYEI